MRTDGFAIQADPSAEEHRDLTIETELPKIMDDFDTAPDGTTRQLGNAIYDQRDDAEYRIFVERDQVLRARVESSEASSGQEPQLTLSITKCEAESLRQMIILASTIIRRTRGSSTLRFLNSTAGVWRTARRCSRSRTTCSLEALRRSSLR